MTQPPPHDEKKTFEQGFAKVDETGDYTFKNVPDPPPGYPGSVSPDAYAFTPFDPDYLSRKNALLAHCCRNPAGPGIKGCYYELARLYKNEGPVHEGLIQSALAYIDARHDCADFVLLGIIRILYQFMGSTLLSDALKTCVVDTVLNFKYWPDEPGIDSMCTWTENHQIMFAANEYLAAQRFPDKTFANSGKTGNQKLEASKSRILKWLELRYLTGFSEWLSHVYYDEDITALINLIDFCDDHDIVRGAEIVLDLICYDMALNSYHGVFGSTHGRSYAEEKRDALVESTTDTQKLLFGMGIFSGKDNMAAVSLSLSGNYMLPRVIYDIANHHEKNEVQNFQRMGIKVREAPRWGLRFDDFESGMVLLSLEAYAHPKTFPLFLAMADAFQWWENLFFKDFKANRKLLSLARKTKLLPVISTLLEKDICRNTREEVHICTYKTPDYMLSSAQDYRRGYGGDQQHIWQATLGAHAVCFTTHPGHEENRSGGYWVGSGTLPRVAQVKNVLVAVYNISSMPGLYMTNRLFFTHAWFPRNEFDEVIEKNGWIFGRKANGYIALRSQNRYKWQDESENRDKEIIAHGKKNIWICEMGRADVDGSFSNFFEKIQSSPIRFRKNRVTYVSPSRGKLAFGWKGPLKQNGKKIPLHNYPRYRNPYSLAAFPPSEILIELDQAFLRLDYHQRLRKASGFVG